MSDLDSLFDQLKPFRKQPLENWHPEKCVEIAIRIDRSGKWFYRDTEIERHRISKLFSTLLRLENGVYYLVTPAVKYRIEVDEVPFVAVELNCQGTNQDQHLYFRTNMDDVVLASDDHPLTVEVNPDSGELSPYLMVRDGLLAKLSRSVYYQLADLAIEIPSQRGPGYIVISDGTEFRLD